MLSDSYLKYNYLNDKAISIVIRRHFYFIERCGRVYYILTLSIKLDTISNI